MNRIKRSVKTLKANIGPKELLAGLVSLLIVVLVIGLMPDNAEELKGLGYLGGFLAMLISSATLILPAPGIAVVFGLGPLVDSPFLLGVAAGIGATLGEMTGYLAGYTGSSALSKTKHYTKLKQLIEQYGLVVIGVLAFIPNPFFDMAGLAAGSTRLSMWKFLIVTAAGKTARCVLIAYAGAYSIQWVMRFF